LGLHLYVGNREFMHAGTKDLILRSEHILQQKLVSYEQQKVDAINYINDRLTAWFLRDKSYTLSSFLGHYSLYGTNLSRYGYTVDGLLYPSIEEDFEGFNIAVAAGSISKISLVRVVHGVFTGLNRQGVSLDLIRVGF